MEIYSGAARCGLIAVTAAAFLLAGCSGSSRPFPDRSGAAAGSTHSPRATSSSAATSTPAASAATSPKSSATAPPTRRPAPTSTRRPTPTRRPAPTPTGTDTRTHYRPPHGICATADFSPFADLGLDHKPAYRNDTGGKNPIQSCLLRFGTASIEGDVEVEADFGGSIDQARWDYDFNRQDVSSGCRKSTFREGAAVGVKSYQCVGTASNATDLFLDFGTVDGTVALKVSVYAISRSVSAHQADLFRRLRQVAAGTLTRLRR
ncbi:MAG TPA: hypothetical protein VHC49_26320 [Mycobacteriales bacterium]|nr:hypothetical protein [Mycobacteriales bacterium]